MIVNKSLVMHFSKSSNAAEAYRMLRTNLLYSKNGQLPQVVVITSTLAGEGKTTTVANLAISFAHIGKKTIIVDADIRKPSIHQFFDISKLNGLSDLLVDPTNTEEYIHHIEECDIDILTSGPSTSSASEALSSKNIFEIFAKLRKIYDVILVDTPPVGIVTDAAVLQPIADGYIIVASEGEATVSEFKRAKEHLVKVGAVILGVVFNKIGSVLGKSNYYYNRYYYYYRYNYIYGKDGTRQKTGHSSRKKSKKRKPSTKTPDKKNT